MIDFWNSEDQQVLDAQRLLMTAFVHVTPEEFSRRFLAAALPAGHGMAPAVAAGLRLAGERFGRRPTGNWDLVNELLRFALYGTFEEVGADGVGALTTEQRGQMYLLLLGIARSVIQEPRDSLDAVLALSPAVPAEPASV